MAHEFATQRPIYGSVSHYGSYDVILDDIKELTREVNKKRLEHDVLDQMRVERWKHYVRTIIRNQVGPLPCKLVVNSAGEQVVYKVVATNIPFVNKFGDVECVKVHRQLKSGGWSKTEEFFSGYDLSQPYTKLYKLE